jgi:hypothetical protein
VIASPAFIRFVVHQADAGSGRRKGLLQVMYDLLASEDAGGHLRPGLLELEHWFDGHLQAPFHQRISGYRVTRRPEGAIDSEPRSISWIKSSAAEHLSKLRHLRALVEEAGWGVDEIHTTRPGEVLCEDEFQIVAIPFADTPT